MILFGLLVVISVVRIVSTYKIFSETWDEVAHVAIGMEWLQNGTYTLEPMHPPLARVAVAVEPFLAGIRWNPQLDMWTGGNAILAARNQYLHNLALARVGVVPFFVSCAFLTWFWAGTRYGATAAGAAALFHDVSGDSRARGFGHHRYGRGRIHGCSARLHPAAPLAVATSHTAAATYVVGARLASDHRARFSQSTAP